MWLGVVALGRAALQLPRLPPLSGRTALSNLRRYAGQSDVKKIIEGRFSAPGGAAAGAGPGGCSGRSSWAMPTPMIYKLMKQHVCGNYRGFWWVGHCACRGRSGRPGRRPCCSSRLPWRTRGHPYLCQPNQEADWHVLQDFPARLWHFVPGVCLHPPRRRPPAGHPCAARNPVHRSPVQPQRQHADQLVCNTRGHAQVGGTGSGPVHVAERHACMRMQQPCAAFKSMSSFFSTP